MIDHDCLVCRLRQENAELWLLIDREFASGSTPHQIHRNLAQLLDAKAPSRSSVYRHFVGDGHYVPHTSPDLRAQNQRARAQRGRELHGAALTVSRASRSRPRGSQRLVEQVASWLLQRNLIPAEAFSEAGIEAPGAHRLGDPMFRTPEEEALAGRTGMRVGRVANVGGVARVGHVGQVGHVGPHLPGMRR